MTTLACVHNKHKLCEKKDCKCECHKGLNPDGKNINGGSR